MNWENLKNNRCPKCSNLLLENKYEGARYCRSISCTFMIRESRFNEILDGFEQDDNRNNLEGYGFE